MRRLLIFDVDGVLEQEEHINELRLRAQLRAIAAKQGVSIKEAEKLRELARSRLPRHHKDTSAYVFMACGFSRRQYFDILDKVDPTGVIRPHRNCAKTLRALRGNTIVTYSNTPRHSTLKTLRALRIDKYIDRAYSSQDFNRSKPALANLRRIMKEQGFKARDTVVIGNSPVKDIAPAKRLGMRTVLFDPHGEFPKAKADHVIRDLKELIHLVRTA